MTRIAVAGHTGRQGRRWVETIKATDGCEFAGGRDTIGSAVEAVIVATPTETHAGMVSALLALGKRVLCEKPLCEAHTLAASLLHGARSRDLRLWVCYPHLWHPVVEAMAKLGSGIDLEVTFVGPTEREPLLDWAPHALSTALYILGTDAQLATCALSKDRKRANVELVSSRGRAHCMFGLGAIKRVSVQTKNQPRHYYNGENCHPTTMQRMLTAWLAAENDPRGAPELTLGVHEILEEVMR